jgi:hypothetical protein
VTIQSIYELFVFDGEEFVTAAYRNLFDREPDEHGFAYYVGRLSLGYGKESIIAQMAKSPECINHHDIKDLNLLINDEKRAQHWLWSLFTRGKQTRNSMQSNLYMLARNRHNINALQYVITTQSQQTNAFNEQMISLNQTNQLLNQRIVELTQQLVTYSSHRQSDETLRLPDEVIQQCFVEILGREPENEEVIKHHARLPTQKVLQEQLINSVEFQQKILAVPEYARLIFKRQIQQKTALEGV